MKEYEDRHSTKREFSVGDQVYVKLQPYRQKSVELRRKLKLSSKLFSPFTIAEKVGAVAYRLKLPERSRIHPVFHVSKLKKQIGDGKQAKQVLPILDEEDQMLVSPEAVLQRRMVSRNNQIVAQVLIRC